MNVSSSSRVRLRRFGLASLLLLLVAVPAQAGMGAQFWQRKKSLPERETTARMPAHCAGCSAVSATSATARPAWPNGRGPLVSSTEAMPTTVHTCRTGGIVRRPSWHNGRGPLEPIVVSGPERATVAQR